MRESIHQPPYLSHPSVRGIHVRMSRDHPHVNSPETQKNSLAMQMNSSNVQIGARRFLHEVSGLGAGPDFDLRMNSIYFHIRGFDEHPDGIHPRHYLVDRIIAAIKAHPDEGEDGEVYAGLGYIRKGLRARGRRRSSLATGEQAPEPTKPEQQEVNAREKS